MSFRALAALLVGIAVGDSALAQTSGNPDPGGTLANRLKWNLRIASAKPVGNDPIYVLLHSSKDCGYCRKWKRDPAGLDNAKKLVDAYENVRVFIVERDTLDADERSNQYPPPLLFAYQQRAEDGLLSPGVPLFEVFLRDELVYRSSGLDTWLDRVIPAVQTMESHRVSIAPTAPAEAAPAQRAPQ